MSSKPEGQTVAVNEVKRFCLDALLSIGVNKDFAEQMAELFLAADCRGHHTYGLALLERYVKDIKQNICDASAKPTILRETSATAWVDGNNGMGPVVGNFCMELAIQKAKKSGIGWVVAKGSNNFGIAMWYSGRALEHNMVPALGLNPISMAAPGLKGDSFMLDMTTTATSFNKIKQQLRKGEPIPKGWALDLHGQPTTDPAAALEARCLMPLGGLEATSGYKGYGLALMVETLCGILGGAAYGPYVPSGDRPANLGQCFVAINPECFAPGFKERMSSLMNALRAMEPADPKKPVLVPGDPERAQMELVEKQGGVRYGDRLLLKMEALAEALEIEPLNSM